MRRNSVKQAVIDRLPESWEHVLRKERKLREFQNLFYNFFIPKQRRKQIYAKRNCELISNYYVEGFMFVIYHMITIPKPYPSLTSMKNADYLYLKTIAKWKLINDKIREYEDACR